MATDAAAKAPLLRAEGLSRSFGGVSGGRYGHGDGAKGRGDGQSRRQRAVIHVFPPYELARG